MLVIILKIKVAVKGGWPVDPFKLKLSRKYRVFTNLCEGIGVPGGRPGEDAHMCTGKG